MTKIEYVIQTNREGEWDDYLSYSEDEYSLAAERYDYYVNMYPKISKLRLIERKVTDPEELILDESL